MTYYTFDRVTIDIKVLWLNEDVSSMDSGEIC